MFFLNSSPQNFNWNRYHLFLQFVYLERNQILNIVVKDKFAKYVMRLIVVLMLSKNETEIKFGISDFSVSPRRASTNVRGSNAIRELWTLELSNYQKAEIEKILNSKLLYNNGRSWQTFMGFLMPKILEYFPDYPVSKLNGIRVKSS